MRHTVMSSLFLVLVGCIESGINENESDLPPVGNPPDVNSELVVDEYIQSSSTEADVLFVISNWWSMEQAYAELVDSFGSMLEVLVGSGIDYHIGVISTDTDHVGEKGQLHEAFGVRWVDTENPNPIDTFANKAVMDATGCVGPRRPRDAAFLALEVKADGWNKGFRREEASMHTVFVSDARDVSTMNSMDEWIGWYNSFTQTKDIDTLSTIVDEALDTQNPSIAVPQIGGTTHPIQSMPWRNVLEEIGLRAQGMKKEYFLSRQPLAGSISVEMTVDGADIGFDEGTVEEGGDWSYDAARNSVYMHEYEAPEGSQIRITYDAGN
jgi:hypothetical protein